MNARRIAEEIAKENYNAYDRQMVLSEHLAESVQVLSEEIGRERGYAAVFDQRDALARKAKQLEGECERLEGRCEQLEGRCEQLAQENAELKQVLSQEGNEAGGVPQVSAESRKRKRT
jgi:DNA repair exonuclease SbcCD ATPase subunit